MNKDFGPLEDDVKDLNGNMGEISKLVKVIYKKMEDSDNRCKGPVSLFKSDGFRTS